MARTPNTRHDQTITTKIAEHRSVTEIAKTLGVSDPTVYKVIHRLRLTLPSKATPTSATAKAAPKRSATPARVKKSAPTATKTTAGAAVDPTRATAGVKAPAKKKEAAPAKKAAATKVAASSAAPLSGATPSVELVPVAQAQDLLTVRVEKGVELLKNLSARIVKHERELASLRQRYADTLETLALS
jgi:hypothetical protein